MVLHLILTALLVFATPFVIGFLIMLVDKVDHWRAESSSERKLRRLREEHVGTLYREKVYVSVCLNEPVVQNSDRVYTLLEIKDTKTYANSSGGPFRKCYKFKFLLMRDNTITTRSMTLEDFGSYFSPADEDDKVEVFSI